MRSRFTKVPLSEPDVADRGDLRRGEELGVAPRDGDVVQEDVVLGVPAGPGVPLFERRSGHPRRSPGSRPAWPTPRGSSSRPRVATISPALGSVVDRADGHRRVGCGRHHGRATGRAEVHARRVAVTALVAEHATHGSRSDVASQADRPPAAVSRRSAPGRPARRGARRARRCPIGHDLTDPALPVGVGVQALGRVDRARC